MVEKKETINYITLASVVSAIAVVFLHTNGCFWHFSNSRYWFTANIIESVFYFAVPIFFMISGAMLIGFDKRYGIKEFFKKRINKTLIPYIVWSFIGLIIQIYILHRIPIEKVDLLFIFNGLINGQLVGIYWFFIPLFCIYLTIPVFSAISEEKRKDIFTYITSIAFILNILVPFLLSVFNIEVTYIISMSLASESIFYTLTGYLLHNYELSRKQINILYILAILGLIMHIVGTYYLSIDANKIVQTYKGYNNLPCVLYSLGVFVFIKYDLIKIMNYNTIKKIVYFLNPYTFGIYLIHWYVLRYLEMALNIPVTSIMHRLITPFIVIALSVVIIYILRKIPIVKKIVP